MKKILSFLSILFVMTSSTIMFGGGIACKSSSKPWTPLTPSKPKPKTYLNLNNLKFYNIHVSLNSAFDQFEINGRNAYLKIETDIIKDYHTLFPKVQLKTKNFNLASTKLEGKSWAIQIYNIDGTNLVFNDTQQRLILSPNYHYLKNNGLKVTITTNDVNVAKTNSSLKTNNNNIKQASVFAYLNKFLLTTANINNGANLQTSDGTNWKTHAVDLSASGLNIGLTLTSSTWTLVLIDKIKQLPLEKRIKISNKIVENLNKQLKNETSYLNNLGILKQFLLQPLTAKKPHVDVGADSIIQLWTLSGQQKRPVHLKANPGRTIGNGPIYIKLILKELPNYIHYQEAGVIPGTQHSATSVYLYLGQATG